jgi:preprotein translocase subunit SecE
MTAVVERIQTLWGSTVQFLREVRVELKKVTWPQRNEIIGSTAVVIVAATDPSSRKPTLHRA